jgi:hypothetical protein
LGYYYNIAISPIDEIIPSGALWATTKLEEGAWAAPEWMASGLIIKARKPLTGVKSVEEYTVAGRQGP